MKTPDTTVFHRKSIRLKSFDYSSAGAYFISICTHNRICLFGDVVQTKMVLTDARLVAENCWEMIPDHYSDTVLDHFVVMPNHVHGILLLKENREGATLPPDPATGANNIRPIVCAAE